MSKTSVIARTGASTHASARADLWRRALGVEATSVLAAPVARCLLVGSVVMAVVSGAANLAVADDLAGDPAIRLALHAATVPALMFSLIAGAYNASTERRVGLTEQRLLSDPSRPRWLGAKALAHLGVGALYGLSGAITALITSSIVFATRDASFDATSWVTIRSLLGVIAATSLFALIGTVVGSMTPNTPAVIAGVVVWALVVEPPAVLGAPGLARWLPSASGLALAYSPDDELLSQPLGALTLIAWAIAALTTALRHNQNADLR